MPSSQPLAIIFDFDNTLVKSHIDFPKLKVEMAHRLSRYGFSFGSDETIPHKFTAGEIIEQAAAYDEEHGTSLARELWSLVESFEREGMRDITVADGITETLAALKQKGFLLIVFTNNAKSPTLEVLQRFHLESFFDLVVAREDVKKMKPDPEGISLILTKFNLSPEQAVFVGDSWVDALAATNAGVRFILIREERLDEAKYGITIWRHIRFLTELVALPSQESTT